MINNNNNKIKQASAASFIAVATRLDNIMRYSWYQKSI